MSGQMVHYSYNDVAIETLKQLSDENPSSTLQQRVGLEI